MIEQMGVGVGWGGMGWGGYIGRLGKFLGLTLWGRMTDVSVKSTVIGSDNGLTPNQ